MYDSDGDSSDGGFQVVKGPKNSSTPKGNFPKGDFSAGAQNVHKNNKNGPQGPPQGQQHKKKKGKQTLESYWESGERVTGRISSVMNDCILVKLDDIPLAEGCVLCPLLRTRGATKKDLQTKGPGGFPEEGRVNGKHGLFDQDGKPLGRLGETVRFLQQGRKFATKFFTELLTRGMCRTYDVPINAVTGEEITDMDFFKKQQKKHGGNYRITRVKRMLPRDTDIRVQLTVIRNPEEKKAQHEATRWMVLLMWAPLLELLLVPPSGLLVVPLSDPRVVYTVDRTLVHRTSLL